MNRSAGDSVTVPSDALAALRPSPAAQAAKPGDGETIAYQRVADPAARVLNQLDGLANSLEKVTAGEPKASKTSKNEHADEECLETYLQRYMQQLTGKKQEPVAVTAPVTSGLSAATPEPEVKQPVRQPAQAPEDRLRITAMRELANDSARRAVAASNNSQLTDKTHATYLITKLVSLLSIVFVVCYFATHSVIALAAATVTFGVAMLGACRFALFCRKMGQDSEAVG